VRKKGFASDDVMGKGDRKSSRRKPKIADPSPR
jgi:hypothetical protein